MQRRKVAARGRLRALFALVAGAIAAVALAIPAAAAAHPGVYTVVPKKAPAGCVYEASEPEGTCLQNSTVQYAVANDGWAMGYTESNGIAGITAEGTAGLINYKLLPGTYRAAMTPEQKLAFKPAQTGLQAHATCGGVAALYDPENIVAWQPREDNDVFFNYIPWQKASAGLGDEPSKWIPVVQRLTGVNLAALSSEAEFESACTLLGGTYHKADTASEIDKAAAAQKVQEAVTPFEAQVSLLTGDKVSLQAQIADWSSKASKLEGERGALETAKADLTNANATLQKQLTSAQQATESAQRAAKKQAKTIKKLRKQLRKAHQHG